MTEVVAALIWDKNKFMICQRPAHKARGLLWEFVGGKVEPGETKEQALIRECREELAVTLDVGKVFMDVVHEYPDLTIHLTLFHATIQEGVPQKLEHNDIRWITVNEIDQYAFCWRNTRRVNLWRNWPIFWRSCRRLCGLAAGHWMSWSRCVQTRQPNAADLQKRFC